MISLPIYPPDRTCLLCGEKILTPSDVNFHVIMDGADKVQLVLDGNNLIVADGEIVLGLFHTVCYDAGLTIDYAKFGKVLIAARNNLFRGDF